MSEKANTLFKYLDETSEWRGYFEHLDKDSGFRGWAVRNDTPYEGVELELYIHSILVAETTTNQSRPNVEKSLQLAQPANIGYVFDAASFIPAKTLDILRRFGPDFFKDISIEDLHVCIKGTQLSLSPVQAPTGKYLDMTDAFPNILLVAAQHLRDEIASGLNLKQLLPIDHEILLRSNPFFLPDWYTETYGDVELSEVDPVEHCSRFSAPLERDTGPWFDTESYLEAEPAAQGVDLAPPLHYEFSEQKSWWPGQGRFRAITAEIPSQSDYAVLIHVEHPDTVPDMQRFLKNFTDDVDVFVSIPNDSPDLTSAQIADLFPCAREILTVPHHGQDVGAFLEAVRHVRDRGYRFFCKAHSQKGNKYPEVMQSTIFNALAATPNRVTEIVKLFRTNARVLMSGSAQLLLHGKDFGQGNTLSIENLTSRLGFGGGVLNRDWAFFAGTCFWIDAELAGLVADVVSTDDFVISKVTPDDETAHAIEHLFCLVAILMGGKVALTDSLDLTAPPLVAENFAKASKRLAPGETARHSFVQLLQSLNNPRIVDGTAAKPKVSEPNNISGNPDTALHDAVDVMVSCWLGSPEPLHNGLTDLGRQLERNGLTWGALVSNRAIQDVFLGESCRNVNIDSLFLTLPQDCPPVEDLDLDLDRDVAHSLLQSAAIFRRDRLPEGEDLERAVIHVRKIYNYWRTFLLRHKVKTFLIWGATAPKSRLFIRLCQDLGIEYQIIERGHFPGTLSIDPNGQFGFGVRPQLLDQVKRNGPPSEQAEEKFRAIERWYNTQQDNAAYKRFQKRDSSGLERIRRAKHHGRPVILLIGGNDQGSGVVGPGSDPLRVNWFGDSDNAFRIIRRLVAAKFSDALLVLRPHPSQKLLQETEFLLVARDEALDELIDSADLCIAIGSTSRAICLLMGKPLLTLGLSELNGQNVCDNIIDETHLLVAMRRHIWANFANPYPNGENCDFIVDLFDNHLVGTKKSVPTRHKLEDLAQLIAGRIQQMKTGFLQDYEGQEDKISKAMFEDVRDRGRAIFPINQGAFHNRERPKISLVLPIYGDYEGTRICFDQLVRHQEDNGYRVIVVWDRGPDLRLRDLCLEYADKAEFTYLENRENVGFSGTVNTGILHAGRDDIILLNSDTVPCGDWALRLQDAAYAHPKIASVVPFSNNATIYNVPFSDGMQLPDDKPVEWAESFDNLARVVQPLAVEMPVSHGYCTYVRRSAYDRLGLYDEMKFGIGQSEDNEFSLRARMAGYFCVCPTNVFMAHAGSTSFGDDITKWLLNGRAMLSKEFSHYFEEIRHFFKVGDPLDRYRRQIVSYDSDAGGLENIGALKKSQSQYVKKENS